MKDWFNETLFYIISSIIITIIAIFLSFTFHNGSILHLLAYAFTLAILVNFITNFIDHFIAKREEEYDHYDE